MVSLLLLPGCLENIVETSGEDEALFKSIPYDNDNDGIADGYTYDFQVKDYGDTTVQRTVVVLPKYDYSSSSFEISTETSAVTGTTYQLTKEQINQIDNYLTEYLISKNNVELGCKRYLGISEPDRLPCNDISTCYVACHPPICIDFKAGLGTPFINDLLALLIQYF